MSPSIGVACTVRPWTKLPLARAVRGIATAGFGAVALPVHGVEEVVTPSTAPQAAHEVGALIADHGLTLDVLSHAADFARTHAATAMRRQLEHCHRLGVRTLVDMGNGEPAHDERYVELLRTAAPIAADLGVRIAVKPHGGLTRTCSDLLSLLERVDHDAVRICLDPGNLVHHAGSAPLEDMARVAPYVVALGVRDHPGRGRPGGATDGSMPPPITPGDGSIDWPGLFAVLRENGFAGPAAVESLTPRPTADDTDEEAARARRTLEALVAGTPRPAPRRPARHACAEVAAGTDETLAGTARVVDRYLLVEIPLPWPPGMGLPLADYPQIPVTLRGPLRRADIATAATGLTMKPLALAPDADYSVPGHTRVLRFDRDPGPSTGYRRSEHVVPDEHAPALIDALFADDPGALQRFAAWRRDDAHRRDLVVCTHASVDACCGRLGYPLYRAVRDRVPPEHPVRVWRISSFGGHRFAPVAIDLPEGRYWGRLTPDAALALVHRTGSPAEIIEHYRGWGALDSPAAQAVERELLAAHGWAWTEHQVQITSVSCTDNSAGTVELHTRDPRAADSTSTRWRAHLVPEPAEVMVGCLGPLGVLPHHRVATLSSHPADRVRA